VIVSFVGAFMGIQVLGGVAALIAFLVYASRHHFKLAGTDVGKMVGTLVENPRVVIASIVLSEGTLLAIALLGTKWGKARPRDRLRWVSARTSPLVLLPMVLGTLAVSEAGDALIALTHWQGSFTLPMLSKAIRGSSSLEFALLLVMAGAVAPVAEEIFFRGYMQTRLVERWGRWRGILFAAACFGILHFDPVHTPLAFLLGIFLGWVAEIAGSIRPSILAHSVNNIIALVGTRVLSDKPDEGPHGALLAVSLAIGAACAVALGRARR
jgi:membrane protease YdiL (CAAX protease family)